MVPQPHPAVLYQPVTDGAVLLHVEQEVYFGLNVVAAQVWQLLSEAADIDALNERLQARYPDISAEVLRADITELLAALTAQGLVTERDQR